MAEYIEKQALLKKMFASHTVPLLMGHTTDEDVMFKTMVSIVEEQPTADVVEVVRCKDCKHSFFIKSCSKYECKKGCGSLKYSNDFCSYGERRVENESERLPESVEETR